MLLLLPAVGEPPGVAAGVLLVVVVAAGIVEVVAAAGAGAVFLGEVVVAVEAERVRGC